MVNPLSPITVLAVALFLTGCASQPMPWSNKGGFDSATAKPATRAIRLISDTQIHESRGTASRIFSLAGDEFISVTVRTGQQVIGSGDLLRGALADKTTYPLTLHLGDAIDVSCQTEWDHFARVMEGELGKPGPRSWLLAPGNHDGYLVGNFLPAESGAYRKFHWNNVCNAGRASAGNDVVNKGIAKDALIAAYVAKLLNSSGTIPSSGSQCAPDGPFCVAYRYGSDAWSSYVIQLVKLPQADAGAAPVYALMLDSSDYPTRPYIWPWKIYAGEVGHVSPAQSQAALAVVQQLPAHARFFIAAHHPFQAWKVENWDPQARAGWNQLAGDPRFMRLLVSAHTHEGGWYEHRASSGTLYELNLGSLSDAPVNFRSLAFEEDAAGAIKVNSALHMLKAGPGRDCSKVPKPAHGYLTSEQASQSERHGDLPIGLPYVVGAGHFFKHFIRFWDAKHNELRPQLLAYVDVISESMPPDHRLSVTGIARPFANRAHLISHMRKLAYCNDGERCSVQEKGHILLALDEYYWVDAPQAVMDAGHQARYCMALDSAVEAGAKSGVVARAIIRSEVGSMIIPAR